MGDEPPIQLTSIRLAPETPKIGNQDGSVSQQPVSSPVQLSSSRNTLRPEHPTHTPAQAHGAGSHGASLQQPVPPQRVTFDRRELEAMLNIYGRMVAAGEWRDYAIDFTRDKAVFSIFRRTADVPVYRIEKDPRLARKQGAYSVVSQTGLILKRGHELPRVLAVLEKPLRAV